VDAENIITNWLAAKNRKAFAYQQQTWQRIIKGQSGLVNAPTGYGKTYAVFLGAIIQYINNHPKNYKTHQNQGLHLLWITPLRALAKDLARAMQEVLDALQIPWKVGIRNGDTSIKERQQQKRSMPQVLLITPESLHLLLASKDHKQIFCTLKIIAVDEWHELLGSKRGVQTELALSYIVHHQKKEKLNPPCIWGISATIGNLQQAKEVLMAPLALKENETFIVRATIKKKINLESILPKQVETYPWAGHLGLKLAPSVLPILEKSKTTLIFINTRGMSEVWYQHLLTLNPELSGVLALHHGSIEQQLRFWVEDALHAGTLKAVVSTSSLDLGVDFRPVEMVIQVGSPKGVARFLQRAGRSGHAPGAESKAYFLPTHSMELLEAAALNEAIEKQIVESRNPLLLCYDVLLQFLCTIATGDGFFAADMLAIAKKTFCFTYLTDEEWKQLLHFITQGGKALAQYDDFKKVEIINGLYTITNRKIAMRHRLHIGTIVSDAMLNVKFLSGGFAGIIEEWFISRLRPGDVFTLAGQKLEFIMLKEMTAIVRRSNALKYITPSWSGGRMALSANLGYLLRKKLNDAAEKKFDIHDKELKALEPLIQLQKKLSAVPQQNELLIELIDTKDGHHLFVYPFEGRLVHEAMAALLAFRLSKIKPISFSIAMNDYGFELLSDQPIPINDTNVFELFTEENLLNDINQSINSTEMARRKFRDIAVIGGLVFQGMPGEKTRQRHLQSTASLLFNVFEEYDEGNLLIRQAYREVIEQQMDEARLRDMLCRISKGKIIITAPNQLTPFCFPIKVDSMRENISSEKLEDRIKKMQDGLKK
jgi:ATP-dependent Lhr-like helicase